MSLLVLGYHWLLLATIDLVGDNGESEVWGIFWGVIPISTVHFRGIQRFIGASSFVTLRWVIVCDFKFKRTENHNYINNQYEPACEILSLLDISYFRLWYKFYFVPTWHLSTRNIYSRTEIWSDFTSHHRWNFEAIHIGGYKSSKMYVSKTYVVSGWVMICCICGQELFNKLSVVQLIHFTVTLQPLWEIL